MTPSAYVIPGLRAVDRREIISSNKSTSNKKINHDKIINAACIVTNALIDEIFSDSRKKDANNARKLLMWYYSERLNYSFKKIGKIFNRKHETVMHHCNRMNELIEIDVEYRNMIKDFYSNLKD